MHLRDQMKEGGRKEDTEGSKEKGKKETRREASRKLVRSDAN